MFADIKKNKKKKLLRFLQRFLFLQQPWEFKVITMSERNSACVGACVTHQAHNCGIFRLLYFLSSRNVHRRESQYFNGCLIKSFFQNIYAVALHLFYNYIKNLIQGVSRLCNQTNNFNCANPDLNMKMFLKLLYIFYIANYFLMLFKHWSWYFF